MKHTSLDSAILFALVIPFIMGVSIGADETPYWLFALIFLFMLVYVSLDIFGLRKSLYEKAKTVLLWVIIVTVIGSAFSAAIVKRHRTAPIYNVHDIVLQQESAIRFFLDGKNPYATTYFNTPLADWHYSDTEINPALYHFVMEPFYLLFALPFYFVSNHTLGYFDGRIPLVFLFLGLLVTTHFLVKDPEKKRLFLVLLAFNPAVLPYTLEGRSDLFMYPFLFLGFFLLYKKKLLLASVPIALAFTVKQSAWLLMPFYVAFLYYQTKSWRKVIPSLLIFLTIFSAIVLPFFFWNQKAFIDSTINYLSGSTAHSYPVSGYGFGRVLNELNVITDLHNFYPFQWWQLGVGLPILVLLLRSFRKNPTVKMMILFYALFLMIYWYFSRYFHNSHLSYISMVIITAYLWPEDEILQKEK